MNTLFVGDIHLKAQVILPIVQAKAIQYHAKQIVFIGDLMDAHGQSENRQLYLDEIDYLVKWKKQMKRDGIRIIFLIGNHDMPYLINEPARSSVKHKKTFLTVREAMYEELQGQIGIRVGDYIATHAGMNQWFGEKEWYFRPVKKSDQERMKRLYYHVGIRRGGKKKLGSPIWADYKEMKEAYHRKVPRQIFGHTPQKEISLANQRIGIDTFAIRIKKEGIEFYGKGDLLLYDGRKLHIIKTKWQTKEHQLTLAKQFYLS